MTMRSDSAIVLTLVGAAYAMGIVITTESASAAPTQICDGHTIDRWQTDQINFSEELLVQNEWLSSLPDEDLTGRIDDSSFHPVRWVAGVGFVRQS